jgi:hypothetical protein
MIVDRRPAYCVREDGGFYEVFAPEKGAYPILIWDDGTVYDGILGRRFGASAGWRDMTPSQMDSCRAHAII